MGPRFSGLGNPSSLVLCFYLALLLLFIHGSGRSESRYATNDSLSTSVHVIVSSRGQFNVLGERGSIHIFSFGSGGRRLYNINT